MRKPVTPTPPAPRVEFCEPCGGNGWVRPYAWAPGEAGFGGEWVPGGPAYPGAKECPTCKGSGRR